MSKTVRVEIETEDGKLAILTDEAADIWQGQIEHAGQMAVAHGSQFVRLPWTETTRVEETVKNNPMWALYDNLIGRLDHISKRLDELVETERSRRLKLDPLLDATMDPKFLGAVMKHAMFEEDARALSLSFVCLDCHATWSKVSKEPDHSSVCPGCGRRVPPTDEEVARVTGGDTRSDGAFTIEEAEKFIAKHGQDTDGKR